MAPSGVAHRAVDVLEQAWLSAVSRKALVAHPLYAAVVHAARLSHGRSSARHVVAGP